MPFTEPAAPGFQIDPRNNVLQDIDRYSPSLDLGPDPTFSQMANAAWDQNSTLANVGRLWDRGGEYFQPRFSTYDPFDQNKGTKYENFPDAFLYANSDEQLERIRIRIDQDEQNSEILSKGGLLGVGLSVGATLFDPINFIPIGGGARALVKGGSILKNAWSNMGKGALLFSGVTTLEQFVLMQQHYNRTVSDAATSVGFATLIGGILGGAVGATRAAKARGSKAEALLRKAWELPEEGKFSTGDTKFFKDWKDANVTLKREAVVNKIPALTPGQRTATSEIQTSRRVSHAIAENGMILEGERGGAAIETIVNQQRSAAFTKLNKSLNSGFRDYLMQSNRLGLKQKLQGFFQTGEEFDKFGEELVNALTRGDISEIPQIEKIAKQWRQVFDEIGQEMIDTDLIPLKKQAIAKAQAQVTKAQKQVDKIVKKNTGQKKQLDVLLSKGNKKLATRQKRLQQIKDTPAKSKRVQNERLNRANKEIKLAESEINKIKKQLTKADEAVKVSRKPITDAEAKLAEVEAKRFTTDDLTLQGTAKSWFPRQYNKPKINKFPIEFEDDIATWLRGEANVDDAGIRETAREIFNKIMGTDGFNNNNPIAITKGAFKGRTLLIPDEILRPWLVNDPLLVMDRWLKNVLSDIELKKTFGSLDLVAEKEIIREEAALLEAANPARATKIRKQMNQDIEDIDTMLLRSRGLEGTKFEDHKLFQTARIIRNWNNARLMGAVALNAFTDLGQMVLNNGFFNTFGGISKLFLNKIANPGKYKAFVKDMEAMGIGVDAFTNSRRSLFELGSGVPLGNTAEDLSRRFANFTFKASLMSNVDGFTKRVAGYAAGERIFRNVAKGSGNLSKAELSWMRNLGIKDTDYSKIAGQFKRFSRKEGSFRLFNADKWTDGAASQAFTAALKKVESVSIITPGIGDAPKIFDNPAWQLLFQYKRFAFAAAQRSLIPALQRTDAGVVTGLGVMFTGAMFREVVNSLINLKDPREIEVSDLIERSIKRTDMVAWLPDLWDTSSALLGNTAYGRSAVDEVMGPSAGWLRSTSSAMQGTVGMLKGETPTKSQIRSMRQLLPMQNLLYTKSLLTGLENDLNRRLGNT